MSKKFTFSVVASGLVLLVIGLYLFGGALRSLMQYTSQFKDAETVLDFGGGDRIEVIQSGLGEITDGEVLPFSGGWFARTADSGSCIGMAGMEFEIQLVGEQLTSVIFRDPSKRLLLELKWQRNGVTPPTPWIVNSGMRDRDSALIHHGEVEGDEFWPVPYPIPKQPDIYVEYQDGAGHWRPTLGPIPCSEDPEMRSVVVFPGFPETGATIVCRARIGSAEPQEFEIANPLHGVTAQMPSRKALPHVQSFDEDFTATLNRVSVKEDPNYGLMLRPEFTIDHHMLREGRQIEGGYHLAAIYAQTPMGHRYKSSFYNIGFGGTSPSSMYDFSLDPTVDAIEFVCVFQPSSDFPYALEDCIPLATCHTDSKGELGDTSIVASELGLSLAELSGVSVPSGADRLTFNCEGSVDSSFLGGRSKNWEVKVFWNDETYSRPFRERTGGSGWSSWGRRTKFHINKEFEMAIPPNTKVTIAVVRKPSAPVELKFPVYRDQLTPTAAGAE
ncbi:hypothetical protein [Sulfuriroseicoccus oceanibius]|uniref:Uncharacterized protein n=1 Tax=Sulfuriroseicoccus oceanibius TaxID=2707525 RepID=A0A6B3L5J7_9BACT|nr:hypothetical protein [Sulfuriroseicoccus oceanibius]QQL45314.1 hypothetical protein G3M56_001625 [Sulfuriroseicoccus oceanibius]